MDQIPAELLDDLRWARDRLVYLEASARGLGNHHLANDLGVIRGRVARHLPPGPPESLYVPDALLTE